MENCPDFIEKFLFEIKVIDPTAGLKAVVELILDFHSKTNISLFVAARTVKDFYQAARCVPDTIVISKELAKASGAWNGFESSLSRFNDQIKKLNDDFSQLAEQARLITENEIKNNFHKQAYPNQKRRNFRDIRK